MNFGFNSNVSAAGKQYHVQTEDRGPSHPYLDTVVYDAGRVVYKRSTSYEDFAGAAKAADLAKLLHERLAQQHKEVIAELEAGLLSLGSQPKAQPPVAAVTEKDGLEIRLRNPRNWFELATGRVTLEIELQNRKSKEQVGGADMEAFLERDRNRTPGARAQTDAAGHATLRFSMPVTASDGTTLVIRATDGTLYGELRFVLVAKPREPARASK